MKMENTGPELQDLFACVSAILKRLTGSMPVYHGQSSGKGVDWYAAGKDPRFTWFRLIERGGSKNPPKSVLFVVQRDSRYTVFGATDGNDWHGPSSNLVVRADSQEDFANLLGYLRERYFELNA